MLENDSIDDSDDDLLGCGIDRDNLINFRAVERPKNLGERASSLFVARVGVGALCLTNRIRICRAPQGTAEHDYSVLRFPKSQELPPHRGGVLGASAQVWTVNEGTKENPYPLCPPHIL